MTIQQILTDSATSISEFKKNPMAVIKANAGMPLAVLNRNQAAFYCVPADLYEQLMDRLEDLELAGIVESRKDDPEVEVNWDDI